MEDARREELSAEAVAALRSSGASFGFAFGSVVDRRDRPISDLDVAAWWADEPPGSWEVAVPDGVDLLVLDEAPLELQGRVALHGRLLFDDDPPARVRWQAQTRLAYLDEEDRQRRSDRDFLTSVVDRRRVRRLLQRIAADLSFLAARAEVDAADLLGHQEPMAAIKYVFVAAIEGCIDVAQHLCASEGWGPPTTNADAIRILGREGVLHEDVAQAVSVAVGFRNVLVHGYVDVDDGRVVGFLERLDDLRQFVEQVSGFVAGADEG